MVGHDAVGEETRGDALQRLKEHPLEGFVVRITEKESVATHGAIQHVEHNTATVS